MSTSVVISARLKRIAAGGGSLDFGALAVELEAEGDAYVHAVQEIGTEVEALHLGDTGTAGYICVKNLDDENFVTMRAGSDGADLVKLRPGEAALFRLATGAPYAVADTAAVRIEYLLVEN